MIGFYLCEVQYFLEVWHLVFDIRDCDFITEEPLVSCYSGFRRINEMFILGNLLDPNSFALDKLMIRIHSFINIRRIYYERISYNKR
jgi:hypothetical protein